MTRAFAPSSSKMRSLTVAVMRRWRTARDHGESPQAAIFATLDRKGWGLLAPALNNLITLFEASSGRPIRVKADGDAELSPDEHRLLAMLQAPDDVGRAPSRRARRSPRTMLKIAVRSTRAMMQITGRVASEERRAPALPR